ncbi:hypothetical protein GCM10010451_10350 [Streptomyces virens]|uniref:Uncharacterized protein n=1 Tax=Streptomyces virens TaxID=285572 RepID=A0ABP6P6C7_9ACTN|nr:hypothetical protein GCM10010247_62440 [Streptomyces calvus]
MVGLSDPPQAHLAHGSRPEATHRTAVRVATECQIHFRPATGPLRFRLGGARRAVPARGCRPCGRRRRPPLPYRRGPVSARRTCRTGRRGTERVLAPDGRPVTTNAVDEALARTGASA